MDETEAIAQLKAGKISGLQRLVEIYQIQAVQTAAMITQDQAAAEDIVQNAFLRAFQRIHQLDTSRPFKPWFFRIVINDALKTAAKQKRHISIDHREDSTYSELIERLETTLDKPEDIVQRYEIRETIRKAFIALSPRQRAVIILRLLPWVK